MVRFVRAAVWVLLASVTGCDDVLGPVDDEGPPLVQVFPELSRLSLSTVPTPSGTIVVVWAVADERFANPETDYALLRLSVNGGAPVDVRLLSEICTDEEGSRWRCRELFITLEDGHSAAELTRLLSSVDAAVTWASETERPGTELQFARVRRFSGPVHAIRGRLAAHPAVRHAERSELADIWPPPPPTDPVLRIITAYVPTLGIDPAPPSARLDVRAGDTLVLEYTQPDGSLIRTSHEVE